MGININEQLNLRSLYTFCSCLFFYWIFSSVLFYLLCNVLRFILTTYFMVGIIVSSKEEVGVSSSFCIDPVDLNRFFEEDGKIYGYQGLKVTSS